jgi:hypothetical protein
MREISPRILIEDTEVDYIDGSYSVNGNLTAAELIFGIPKPAGDYRKLWNREVTMYLNKFDSVPLFRGWIKRAEQDLNSIEVRAEDAIGYLVRSGGQNQAKLNLTDDDNLDGTTAGGAMIKAITKANLQDKIKTDFIGNTSPLINSVSEPLRGSKTVHGILTELLSKAVDNSGTLPRPNIARLIDDGTNSQLIIELESDIDSDTIVHTYTEHDNIVALNIINRKIPTFITVNGANGVTATFKHTSAITALDNNPMEVDNDNLTSPAACLNFAQKLFRANLKNQFEYSIEITEGAYLTENDVIKIVTDDPDYSGNYRVIGKQIEFTPDSFSIGITINRKPPTLAEYLESEDN